jgi:hypothetical protein
VVALLLLCAHFAGCLLVFFHVLKHEASGSSLRSVPVSLVYLRSAEWALETLLTASSAAPGGYVPIYPGGDAGASAQGIHANGELGLCMAVIGAMITAVIFGAVCQYITEINAEHVRYHQRTAEISQFIAAYCVGPKLAGRLSRQADIAWQDTAGFEFNQLLQVNH